MRATVMFGAGDVRIETLPDARAIEPSDAVVVVSRACNERAAIDQVWSSRNESCSQTATSSVAETY